MAVYMYTKRPSRLHAIITAGSLRSAKIHSCFFLPSNSRMKKAHARLSHFLRMYSIPIHVLSIFPIVVAVDGGAAAIYPALMLDP